jgi:hypothetical protein
MHKNMMIYGSCVSRDAFELLPSGYTLLGYVARQSLISALSKPTALLDGETLGSAFQNRSLSGDLKSNLLPTVRRYASSLDVLVIDLTDERLGVIRLPDGTFVTRSSELAKSGRLTQVKGTRRNIDAATEDHWNLWEAAAGKFFDAITSLGLREKTIVLNAPWARVTELGDPVPAFRGLNNDEQVSAYLARCSEHLKALGFEVASLPEELRVAHSSHKWGPAPYHFGMDANRWIADQMVAAAAGAAPARS